MSTNAYATLAELKSWLGISDSNDDTLLDGRLDSASRWIDYHCRRHFFLDAGATRYFTACQSDRLLIDDLNAVTSIKSDDDGNLTYETTWASSDYVLEPFDRKLGGVTHPFTKAFLSPQSTKRFPTTRRGVEIVGSWGWPAVPFPIKDATLVLATRWWKRKEAPLGTTGSPELGIQNVPIRDPDVVEMLKPFVNGPVIA